MLASITAGILALVRIGRRGQRGRGLAIGALLLSGCGLVILPNAAVGRIEVTGGTKAERTIFYTALYHALMHMNLSSDVNGEYAGFDGRVVDDYRLGFRSGGAGCLCRSR